MPILSETAEMVDLWSQEHKHLDVISNSNSKLNSSKVLKGIHFKNSNEYYVFKVDFHYENEKDIEYRVIKLKKERQVWVDYAAVAMKIN